MAKLPKVTPTRTILFLLIALWIWNAYVRPYGATGAVDAERVYGKAISEMDISICDKMHSTSLIFGPSTGQLRRVCHRKYLEQHPDP